MTNKNASGFPAATDLAGVSFLARLAGRWINVTDLVQPAKRVVSHKTADFTILATDTGKVFTNLGSSGAITLTLPAAVEGLTFTFVVRAAQQLRVDPNGSETIGAGSAGQYYWADAVNETLVIMCAETGKWTVMSTTGTWTFV